MAERTPPSRRSQDSRISGERQASSRRSQDRRTSGERQASSRRTSSEKQSPSRRNDVIRCENCGEDYSITYKRCPFCDERPGRTGISGRRVAGAHGSSVHPVQVVSLVISLIIIITALFIVVKYMGPLLFGSKDPAGSSSSGTSTSQSSAGSSSDQSQPDGSADTSGGQTGDTSDPGDVSQPAQVTVNSISLNRSDITLPANESYQFTVTVDPAGTEVTWTSSDPSVLTVDQDGIVKNINSGSSQVQVTITAAAGDKSAECIVRCRGSGTGSSDSGTSGSGTGGSSSGPVAANTPGTIVNAGGGLNVRSGPGSSYEKVASIKNGDQIIILEDTGDGWYKIDYGAGKTGYVSSDYVSPNS